MKIEEIYAAAADLKTLMIDRGYTRADVRIGFHYIGFPLAIVLETGMLMQSKICQETATTKGFQHALHEARGWIQNLPDAKQAAKIAFMQKLANLSLTAEELGIELPVKLVI